MFRGRPVSSPHVSGRGKITAGPGATGWSNFKQNLPVFAEHYRTLLIDQPGYGKSDKPKHSMTQVEIGATAVRDLLDTLGIEKASLIGNSVNIFAPEPSEGMKVLINYYAPPGPSLEKTQALIASMMYDSSGASPELLQERFDAAQDPEAMAYTVNMFSQLGGASPMEELWMRIHEITHRTLLIWGRDDRVLPLEGALFMLKRMQDARLLVFSKCGHWAQLEKQDEFDRAAIDFLSAN